MSGTAREHLSTLVIKVSLGGGGSFLAATFILQGFLNGGFMLAAAVSTFTLVAIVCYAFARIKPHVFSLLTILWLIVLALRTHLT